MKYPCLPGLTPDGTVYQNSAMGTVEAMLPPGPWATAHAPALLETPDGSLLCAWFAGSFEGSGDVSIVCARLPKGAARWEAPVQVSHDEKRSEQNPSLFLAPDGAVWAVYTAQLDRVPGKDNMQFTSVIRRQKSTDGGRTWGEPDVLFAREGSFCRQPIQVLASGRWIFANWLCSDSASGLAGDPTAFQISDDQGCTWRTVEMPGSNGRVHANVVELAPGRLAAFMRSRAADFIYRSESLDDGNTWSEPVPTVLPNNNSSISAVKLQSMTSLSRLRRAGEAACSGLLFFIIQSSSTTSSLSTCPMGFAMHRSASASAFVGCILMTTRWSPRKYRMSPAAG